MKFVKSLFILACLISTSAHASLVTLESNWCCGGIPGTFTFTYDNTISDSIHDEYLDGPLAPNQVQNGQYDNAILSATYVVNSGINKDKIFSFNQGDSSSIRINRKSVSLGTTLWISLDLYDGDDKVIVFLGVEGISPLNDSLLELPNTRKADMATLQIGSMLSNETYPGGFVFKDVSNVPIPSAAWLFGPSLLGLAGVVRKRNVI